MKLSNSPIVKVFLYSEAFKLPYSEGFLYSEAFKLPYSMRSLRSECCWFKAPFFETPFAFETPIATKRVSSNTDLKSWTDVHGNCRLFATHWLQGFCLWLEACCPCSCLTRLRSFCPVLCTIFLNQMTCYSVIWLQHVLNFWLKISSA